MGAIHRSFSGEAVHTPFRWVFANAAARAAATGVTSGDINKIALQVDDGSVWRLVDSTPTWAAFGFTVSDFIKTLLDDANDTAARTTLKAQRDTIYITAAVDCDTLTTAGYYAVYAASCTHFPVTGTVPWSVEVVHAYNVNNLIQRATNVTTGKTYVRCRYGGTWGAWAEIGGGGKTAWLEFTRYMSSAAGTVNYTGVGFRPKAALVFASLSAGGNNVASSIGIVDETHQVVTSHSSTNSAMSQTASYCVYLFGTLNVAWSRVGAMSFLDDGFGITWTNDGSPAGDYYMYVKTLLWG